MKDIIHTINEGKYRSLFSEVQNEVGKGGEYHTYEISNGKKKFKKGFLAFNKDNDFFTVTAFNTAKEFSDALGFENTYDEYENINIGDCIKCKDNDGTISNVLRIW